MSREKDMPYKAGGDLAQHSLASSQSDFKDSDLYDFQNLDQSGFKTNPSEYHQPETRVPQSDFQDYYAKSIGVGVDNREYQAHFQSLDQVQDFSELLKADQLKSGQEQHSKDNRKLSEGTTAEQQNKSERFQPACTTEYALKLEQFLKNKVNIDNLHENSGVQISYANSTDCQSTLLPHNSALGEKVPSSVSPFLTSLPGPVSTPVEYSNHGSLPMHLTTKTSISGQCGSATNPMQTAVSKSVAPKISQESFDQVLTGNSETIVRAQESQLLFKTSEPSKVENERNEDTALEIESTRSKESLNSDVLHVDYVTETGINRNANMDTRKNSENANNYLCFCNEDFSEFTRKKVKKYSCGYCFDRFVSICELHAHIEAHGSGGSYHFDHIGSIAYPKYETFCSFTQTDEYAMSRNDDLCLPDKDSESTCVDMNVDANDTRNEISKQVEKDAKLEAQETQLTRKCRKRKQDNPKPTKSHVTSPIKTGEKNKVTKSKSESQGDSFSPMFFRTDAGKIKRVIDVDEIANGKDPASDCSAVIPEVLPDTSKTKSKLKTEKKRSGLRTIDDTQKAESSKKRKLRNKDKNASKGPKKKRKTRIKDDTNLGDTDTKYDEFTEKEKVDVPKPENENVRSNKRGKLKTQKTDSKFQMCDVCGVPVPKYNYKYHMRKHTGEKPYICDKCGKTFAHKRFLVKHLLTHAEDKPWKCKICPAQFCQKNEYKMHLNGHEGKRPFQCKVCEMKFFSRAMMNTHQANVHMGVTKFECGVCSRRFFKRSSLTVHEASHYEPTLKCGFCDRMFKDKTGLKRHERIHTREKLFRCHICEHEFIQSTPYWVHMEKKHFMKRETVKNMLKDIRENNKKVGIHTKITELPKGTGDLSMPKNVLEDGKAKMISDLIDSLKVEKSTTDVLVSGNKPSDSPSLQNQLLGNKVQSSQTPTKETEENKAFEYPALSSQLTRIQVSQNVESTSVNDAGFSHAYTSLKVPNLYSTSAIVSDSGSSDIYLCHGVSRPSQQQHQQQQQQQQQDQQQLQHQQQLQQQQQQRQQQQQLQSNQQQQSFSFHLPVTECVISDLHNNETDTGSSVTIEASTFSSQSLVVPVDSPIPSGLGVIGLSMTSQQQQHGFIGLNTLQPPCEYSDSLPSTGIYTDISTDRVDNTNQ